MAKPPDPRDPLVMYLRTESETMSAIQQTFLAERDRLARELAILAPGDGISDQLSKLRMEAAQASIDQFLSREYNSLDDLLHRGVAEMAKAASGVVGREEAFFYQMGKDAGLDVSSLIEAESYRTASTVETLAARLRSSSQALSDQVWKTKALTSGQLNQAINSAIARGLSWSDFSKEVIGFIDPTTPGGAPYAAKRLARTELNNAFKSAQLQRYADSGVVEYVKWNLSRSHPEKDICDDYAAHRIAGPEVVTDIDPSTVRYPDFLDPDYFEEVDRDDDEWGYILPSAENATEAEREALHQYGAYLYDPMNRYMRGDADWKRFLYGEDPSLVTGYSKTLQDFLMKSAGTSRDGVLYRGQFGSPGVMSVLEPLGIDSAYASTEQLATAVGKKLHVSNFLSTSMDKGSAFSSDSKVAIDFEINIPKGSKGATLFGLDPGDYAQEEHEFLLPAGSDFLIQSIERTPEGPIKIVMLLLRQGVK